MTERNYNTKDDLIVRVQSDEDRDEWKYVAITNSCCHYAHGKGNVRISETPFLFASCSNFRACHFHESISSVGALIQKIQIA